MGLATLGWQNVRVLDRLAEPQRSDATTWGDSDRSYNIGVSETGQRLLEELGVMPRVLACSTPLLWRKTWSPQAPEGQWARQDRYSRTRDTVIIQRDRLVACMLEHIQEQWSGVIKVDHDMTVDEVTPGMQVGADGASSDVLAKLEEADSRVKCNRLPEKRKNTRVYRTLLLPLPKDNAEWINVASYSERSKAGRVLECLPTKEDTQVGLVLFLEDDTEVLGISSAEEARAFLQAEFPNVFPIIPESEIQAFATRPPGKLPAFKYAGPRLHLRGNIVLLGDVIHTIKPYFGLGVNSALNDVEILMRKLQDHPESREQALQSYSEERAPDARALVQASHTADQGFLYFVVPIILDTAFNKFAPWLFGPSTMKMMQVSGLRFSQIQRKKRIDRVLQVLILGTMFAALIRALVYVLRAAFTKLAPMLT